MTLRAEVRCRTSSADLAFDAVVRGADGVVYAEVEGYRTTTLPGSVGETDLAHFRSIGQPAS
jgi:hypothetical protein